MNMTKTVPSFIRLGNTQMESVCGTPVFIRFSLRYNTTITFLLN